MKILAVVLLFLVTYGTDAYSPKQCSSCHASQVSNWQRSDHAKAMAVANDSTVLGDFENATVNHYTQKARFYKENSKFLIESTEGEVTKVYEVIYTFGHYPLQQYIVPADSGRFQVFPFTWDSRPEDKGGQRWYPIYADADIKPNNRLHWQQPLQNWNGMCADCHSDGVTRNYSIAKNNFNTQWDNINIGCQSCHGTMINHPNDIKLKSVVSTNEKTEILNWLLKEDESVARLRNKLGKPASQPQKQQRQQSMDTCFACHSLRAPLTDGIQPGLAFLDQFMPNLLSYPHYFADGQIRDEVYVYGSFLQSRMFAEGVTCLDCHDPHTMKVKTQSNGLCLQCHSSQIYQQTEHIRHELGSEAGKCVNCHMPERVYMGVDARRDHSFKLPRPELSSRFDTPNVCTDCHHQENAQWAEQQLNQWYGKGSFVGDNELMLMKLLHGQSITFQQLVAIVNDTRLAEIQRASALALLAQTQHVLTDKQIRTWVASEQPLIRLAAAKIGSNLSLDDRQKSYITLLSDKYRAIRVAAAEHLIYLGLENSDVTQKAFGELATSFAVSSWRGEGNLNKSLVEINLGESLDAIKSLKHSIKIDPYFEPAYLNLADVYRATGAAQLEADLYSVALQRFTRSAQLQFAHGLFLVRTNERPAAVVAFKKAMQIEPQTDQYAYLYLLALDSVGKTKQALHELQVNVRRYDSREFVQLGLSFAHKLNDSVSYEYFLNKQ